MNRDPTMVTEFETVGELLETEGLQREMIKDTLLMIHSEADHSSRVAALTTTLLAYLEKTEHWNSHVYLMYCETELTKCD